MERQKIPAGNHSHQRPPIVQMNCPYIDYQYLTSFLPFITTGTLDIAHSKLMSKPRQVGAWW